MRIAERASSYMNRNKHLFAARTRSARGRDGAIFDIAERGRPTHGAALFAPPSHGAVADVDGASRGIEDKRNQGRG